MRIDKKDALKNLWNAYEDIMKSLKALSDNPIVGSVTDQMWNALESYKRDIQQLPRLDTDCYGKWFQWIPYGNQEEKLIFKALHLDTNSSKSIGLGIKIQVLAASKNRHHYNEVSEFMWLDLNTFLSLDHIKEITLNPQELPLYISYEFKGTLFESILANMGIPYEKSTPEIEE